jgi:NAD(P)-dependent dehydrogenase (short-subunit alcohol dehydrogenase family)
MERQGSGAIVNVSSLASLRCSPVPMLAYNTTKAGVNALTCTIAVQYAAKGIRANAILPGLIRTPMAVDAVVRRYGVDRDKLVHARDRAVPMQRMGEAWDVAWAAVYLASDEARYVTGVLLPVDGGLACKG